MSDDIEKQRETDLARLREAVAVLGEHFDCVQIFANRYEEGGDGNTTRYNTGTGNWYARFGHIAEWVEIQRAIGNAAAIKDQQP